MTIMTGLDYSSLRASYYVICSVLRNAGFKQPRLQAKLPRSYTVGQYLIQFSPFGSRRSIRVQLPSLSIGCSVDLEAGLSASSSLDEGDMSLGMIEFKTKRSTKLKVFDQKRTAKRTHGCAGRTCDNTTWTVAFRDVTSALPFVVPTKTQ